MKDAPQPKWPRIGDEMIDAIDQASYRQLQAWIKEWRTYPQFQDKKYPATGKDNALRERAREMYSDIKAINLAQPRKQVGGGVMRGGSVYSLKHDAKWYGNRDNTQDKFVPFGSKLIHQERFLNDNVLNVFYKCGKSDDSFPVRKVNQHFAKVLRSMINNKAPDFEAMNALNDDDKRYLHQLLRATKLQGYYSVPMPDKDDELKDHERFEWCLGQIRAGNNNPDIVRELKLKLMRFRNDKKLPRAEANRILYELNDLGY